MDWEVFTSLLLEVTLRNYVKALNDTRGPEGTIPSLLVFDTLTKLPAGVNESPAKRREWA